MAQDICLDCKETMDISLLQQDKNRTRGYRRLCKPCNNERTKKSYFKRHEKNKARRRKYREANKEKINKVQRERSKNYILKSRYGISEDIYNEMLSDQNNVCYLCGEEEKLKNKSLAVDHCHSTGEVRKLLCHACNTGLGKFKDDIELLEKAIKYLKGEL